MRCYFPKGIEMATDMDILCQAYNREKDPRDRRPDSLKNWEYFSVGATREDVKRLQDEGLVEVSMRVGSVTKYKLSEKGKNLVWATTMEQKFEKVPAESILQAMDLVVGFDDIKERIAKSIESKKKINFLLQGPSACGKSLLMEAVRSSVPSSYIVFGSRTSASGLSDVLFEQQPSVLLMDEADKMHHDVYSVMLGLMEGGEILETKSKKTRGIKLETIVIAACNGSDKMPREFLSRFALHVRFPEYTRDEFINVCKGFLSRVENCPIEIANIIGEKIYDYGIGDVRKARGAWLLMDEPTENEAEKVIQLMLKYGPDANVQKKRNTVENKIRMPGM